MKVSTLVFPAVCGQAVALMLELPSLPLFPLLKETAAEPGRLGRRKADKVTPHSPTSSVAVKRQSLAAVPVAPLPHHCNLVSDRPDVHTPARLCVLFAIIWDLSQERAHCREPRRRSCLPGSLRRALRGLAALLRSLWLSLRDCLF